MLRIMLLVVSLGLGVSARADISDSGNLTIGGTGVIQGTMTVQGNAFSVGGATFAVAGGSITLGGLLNAGTAGIKWADGSTSTTAATSPVGLTRSSTTINPMPNASFTNIALGPCHSGSTLTLTTNGGKVRISVAGSGANSTLEMHIGLLQDGAFVEGTNSTKPITSANCTGNGNPINMSFSWVTPTAPSAGSHTWCLTLRQWNGGTGYWPINGTGWMTVEELP